MSHMVIFQTPDGNPGYNQFETIEEAVRFVEVLRTEQGVENARMFALEEVKFDFKPYYRVELDPPMLNAGPATSSSQSAPSAPASQPAPSAQPPQAAQPPASPSPSPEPAAQAPRPPAAPSGEGPGNGFKPQESTAPSSAPAPGAPPAQQESSPVGSEAPVSTVPPPTFMAGASEREEQPATTRRGLFGR